MEEDLENKAILMVTNIDNAVIVLYKVCGDIFRKEKSAMKWGIFTPVYIASLVLGGLIIFAL